MNDRTRKRIQDYVAGIDEYVPSLLAVYVSEKFNVTYTEAISVICPPRPVAKPHGQACHYCGLPAVGYGAFGEPVCEECGG